ncbi:MAG: alpha/beta hydrolase [Candidatus Peribacteria bacterium]|jgi:pimeloyl-ACP methyl ester carboxylesterase|nr:alpha/beta hydrolase [Candidatus Peribacteria bacterium]
MIYVSQQLHVHQIVLVGLSFGELAVRDLICALSETIKNKVVGHLSINGIFCSQDLKPSYQIIVPLLSTRLAKVLLGIIEHLDKNQRPFIWNAFQMRVYIPSHRKNDKSKTYQESLQKLQKAGMLGLTSGLSDRARQLLQATQPQMMGAIPTIAIASTDDDTYKNPKTSSTAINSAQRIVDLFTNVSSKVVILENAGHAALVENPEPYNGAIREALHSFGRKEL